MSYTEFMNRKIETIKLTLSPSEEVYDKIRKTYFEKTGSDNYYDHREIWDSIYKEHQFSLELKNSSFKEAQVFAEPIRISHPDQCVSLYGSDNSFIGNTSWADQLKMFFEYETYTEVGKSIMEKRKAEAEAAGEVASWE